MKHKLRRSLIPGAVAGLLLGLGACPALGADSATVNAKVTVASPCLKLTVAVPTMDFGTRSFSTTVANAGANVGIGTADNCSASAENVSVKGTDAVGSTATWTLADPRPNTMCSVGVNKYMLTVSKSPLATGNVALALIDQQLVSIPAAQSVSVNGTLAMPCSGSGGGGETMAFQIIYTASL